MKLTGIIMNQEGDSLEIPVPHPQGNLKVTLNRSGDGITVSIWPEEDGVVHAPLDSAVQWFFDTHWKDEEEIPL